jgi:hypothetical protein
MAAIAPHQACRLKTNYGNFFAICPVQIIYVVQHHFSSFKYSPDQKVLELEMSMHQSDNSKTIAECIFWFWHDKNIGILEVGRGSKQFCFD